MLYLVELEQIEYEENDNPNLPKNYSTIVSAPSEADACLKALELITEETGDIYVVTRIVSE